MVYGTEATMVQVFCVYIYNINNNRYVCNNNINVCLCVYTYYIYIYGYIIMDLLIVSIYEFFGACIHIYVCMWM
jgi:hypothetical protein